MRMSNVFILVSMIFMHYIGDFILQTPFMSYAKQKRWWITQYDSDLMPMTKYDYERKYGTDYFDILMAHSIIWSFCIMFPIAINQKLQIGMPFITIGMVNAGIHAYVDNMKCNNFAITLGRDQTIHIGQIFITFLLYVILFKGVF